MQLFLQHQHKRSYGPSKSNLNTPLKHPVSKQKVAFLSIWLFGCFFWLHLLVCSFGNKPFRPTNLRCSRKQCRFRGWALDIGWSDGRRLFCALSCFMLWKHYKIGFWDNLSIGMVWFWSKLMVRFWTNFCVQQQNIKNCTFGAKGWTAPIQGKRPRKIVARRWQIEGWDEISNFKRRWVLVLKQHTISGFNKFQDMQKQVQGTEFYKTLGGPGIGRRVGRLCYTPQPAYTLGYKNGILAGWLDKFQIKETPRPHGKWIVDKDVEWQNEKNGPQLTRCLYNICMYLSTYRERYG